MRRIQLQDRSGLLGPLGAIPFPNNKRARVKKEGPGGAEREEWGVEKKTKKIPQLNFHSVEAGLDSHYIYNEFFFYQDMAMLIRLRAAEDRETKEYLLGQLHQHECRYLKKHPYTFHIMEGKRANVHRRLTQCGTDIGTLCSKRVLQFLLTKKIQTELGKTYEPGESIDSLSDGSVLHLEKLLNLEAPSFG